MTGRATTGVFFNLTCTQQPVSCTKMYCVVAQNISAGCTITKILNFLYDYYTGDRDGPTAPLEAASLAQASDDFVPRDPPRSTTKGRAKSRRYKSALELHPKKKNKCSQCQSTEHTAGVCPQRLLWFCFLICNFGTKKENNDVFFSNVGTKWTHSASMIPLYLIYAAWISSCTV